MKPSPYLSHILDRTQRRWGLIGITLSPAFCHQPQLYQHGCLSLNLRGLQPENSVPLHAPLETGLPPHCHKANLAWPCRQRILLMKYIYMIFLKHVLFRTSVSYQTKSPLTFPKLSRNETEKVLKDAGRSVLFTLRSFSCRSWLDVLQKYCWEKKNWSSHLSCRVCRRADLKLNGLLLGMDDDGVWLYMRPVRSFRAHV